MAKCDLQSLFDDANRLATLTSGQVNLLNLVHTCEIETDTGVGGVEEIEQVVLLLTYSSTGCKEEFTLQWEPQTYNLWNIVEIAASDSGPWFDYIYYVPQNEDIALGIARVTINNPFGGTRFFRVTQSGQVRTTTVNPDPSTLALPELDEALGYISNMTVSTKALQSNGLTNIPYSSIENSYIQPYTSYIEPTLRLIYAFDNASGNWNGLTTVAAFKTRSDGATIKYTVDRTDPQSDTINRDYEKTTGNVGAYRHGTGFVLKARAFVGGCVSPVMCVLLDQQFPAINYITPILDRKNAALLANFAVEDEEGVDVFGPFYAGPNWTTPEDIADIVALNTCRTVSDWSDGRTGADQSITAQFSSFGSAPRLVQKAKLNTADKFILPYWPGFFASGENFSFSNATFRRPATLWNAFKNAFTSFNIEIGQRELESGDPYTITDSENIGTGDSFLGSGGSSTQIETEIGIWTRARRLTCTVTLGADPQVFTYGAGTEQSLTDFSLIHTAHQDDPPVRPPYPSGGIPVPVDPAIVTDPELRINIDLFDEYPLGTPTVGSLDTGSGWAAAWVLADNGDLIALDTFETYTQGDFDDGVAAGGSGWSEEPWVTANNAYQAIYEDFEDFTIEVDPVPLDVFEDGWNGVWIFEGGFTWVVDDFEPYTVGLSPTGLDEPEDFGTPWVVADAIEL